MAGGNEKEISKLLNAVNMLIENQRQRGGPARREPMQREGRRGRAGDTDLTAAAVTQNKIDALQKKSLAKHTSAQKESASEIAALDTARIKAQRAAAAAESRASAAQAKSAAARGAHVKRFYALQAAGAKAEAAEAKNWEKAFATKLASEKKRFNTQKGDRKTVLREEKKDVGVLQNEKTRYAARAAKAQAVEQAGAAKAQKHDLFSRVTGVRTGAITGEAASAYREARESPLGRKGPAGKAYARNVGLQAAGAAAGPGIIGDMLSSTGAGGQIGSLIGGGIGTFFGGPGGRAAGIAIGNWAGRIAGAAIPAALLAADTAKEQANKLGKSSAQYLKYTNQIPASLDGATRSIEHFGAKFNTAFIDATLQTAVFGVKSDETRAMIDKIGESIRLVGDDAPKKFGDMAVAATKLATELNISREEAVQQLTENVTAFNMSVEESTAALGTMYDANTAANKVFEKELDGARLRMDSLNKTIFQGARDADLWSLNYKEVSDRLVVIGVEARKAGASTERMQKIQKGMAGFMAGDAGQMTTFLESKVGAKGIERAQEATKGVPEKDRLGALTALYKGNTDVAKRMLLEIDRIDTEQKGVATDTDAITAGKILAGLPSAIADRNAALLEQLAGRLTADQERIISTVFKTSSPFSPENRIYLEAIRKGPEAFEKLEAQMKADKEAKQKALEVEGKGPGAAAAVEFAASGAEESWKNLITSVKEAAAATTLAGTGLSALTIALRGIGATANSLMSEETQKTQKTPTTQLPQFGRRGFGPTWTPAPAPTPTYFQIGEPIVGAGAAGGAGTAPQPWNNPLQFSGAQINGSFNAVTGKPGPGTSITLSVSPDSNLQVTGMEKQIESGAANVVKNLPDAGSSLGSP